jgi:hypothetical protein
MKKALIGHPFAGGKLVMKTNLGWSRETQKKTRQSKNLNQ